MNNKKQKIILKESILNFNNQLCLLRKACESDLKGKAREVRVLIASACSTGTALVVLGDNPDYFYLETMMLSRSLLEKIINYCYLQVCSDTEFERFLLHPWYRQYHNLNRYKKTEKTSLGIKYSGIDSFKKHPQVKNALERFSETNEKKDWSKKSIDKKVNIIGQNTNIDMGIILMNTLTVYSSASESLHGSLFGCTYHTGVYDPSINHENKEDVNENNLKMMIILYSQMGSLIHDTLKILKLKNNNVDEILKSSEINEKKSISLIKDMLGEKIKPTEIK